MVKAATLSELKGMLLDSRYSSLWGCIERRMGLIGLQSHDSEAVEAILHYIRRADDVPDLDALSVMEKLHAPRTVGIIGGDEAIEVLKTCLSREGAEDLIADWIDSRAADVLKRDRDSLIAFIRGNSAIGLVCTGDAESIKYVEDMYSQVERDLRGLSRQGRQDKYTFECGAGSGRALLILYSTTSNALASRDLINRIGIRQFVSLSAERRESMLDVAPYMEAYLELLASRASSEQK